MLLFTVLVSFCLVSAFITYALGIFVFAQNTRSTVNRLFLASTLTAAYWGMGEFLLWQAGRYEWFVFWLKFSSFWIFAIVFAIHFILTFTDRPFLREVPPLLLAGVLYIPSAAFALTEIFTDSIFAITYEAGRGFVYYPVQGSFAYLAEFSFVIVLMLFALYAGFTAWREAPPGKIRRQNRLVFCGFLTVMGFGSLSGVFLPAVGVRTPNLVFIGIVIFSIFIAYAILRYGLFTLTPQAAVPDILRTMPDGLILTDREGRILTANPAAAAIFRVREDELPGRSFAEFLHGPVSARLLTALREQGTVPDSEATLEGKGYRVISIAGSVVRDPDNPEREPAGMVLIFRDITGRKISETTLRIANEKISLLTQLTRHDISNLVTALSGYLGLIADDRSGPEAGRYLATSREIVDRINEYLRFSREYQDIGQHEPVWLPLQGMIERAAAELRPAGITINSRVGAVVVYADPLIAKVVYNILENAVRHGGHISRVLVTGEQVPDGDLVVAFEDDGMGVREEDKERIFRHGFGKHTGFGLALSREVLSLTGIRIAETGKAGKGARFELRIPPQAWRTP